MTTLSEMAKKNSELMHLDASRVPDWSTQTDTEGAPEDADDGVSVEDAIKTLVHVPLRADAHRRTAKIIVGFDPSATYTVEVDEHSVDVPAGGDIDETLDDIVDAITAHDEMSDIVTADVWTPPQGDDQVRLRGDVERDFDLSVSTTDGAILGVIAPSAADVRVWLLPDGIGDVPGQWVLAHGGEFEVGRRGITERLTTSGYSRMYVEVDVEEPEVANVEARPVVAYVGPGVME